MKQPRHEKVLQDCKEEVAKSKPTGEWESYHLESSYRDLYDTMTDEVLPLYAKKIAIEYASKLDIKDTLFKTHEELYDQFLTELID